MRAMVLGPVLLFTACGFAPDDERGRVFPAPAERPATVGGASEVDARFVGTWVVDQPGHALYEASVYEFRADGALALLGSFSFDQPMEGYQTGQVAVSDDSCGDWYCEDVKFVCGFGQQWAAPDSDTLLIQSPCDDGVTRDVELSFTDDASANSQGQTTVIIERVGEHDDAFHWGPDWRFVKCLDDNGAALTDHWACEQPVFEGQ